MAEGLKPFSNLSRALYGTKLVMIWERLLPALAPFMVSLGAIGVAGQWGLFLHMALGLHIGLMIALFIIAAIAGAYFLKDFKTPSFSEINERLALDNDLKPERLLAMRHETKQPPLKLGKAKAGFAKGDPMALRFVLVLLAVFGLVIKGPVPVSQIKHALLPFCHSEKLK